MTTSTNNDTFIGLLDNPPSESALSADQATSEAFLAWGQAISDGNHEIANVAERLYQEARETAQLVASLDRCPLDDTRVERQFRSGYEVAMADERYLVEACNMDDRQHARVRARIIRAYVAGPNDAWHQGYRLAVWEAAR